MSCHSRAVEAKLVLRGVGDRHVTNMDELRAAIGNSPHPVYSYVVTTVKITLQGKFQQTGSAPNFDGDRITLCTCKHRDRATFHPSNHPADPWRDVWVAGFTCKRTSPSRSLIYLMQVDRWFTNQHDLWRHLPNRIRQAKSSRRNVIGDLYEPQAGAALAPHDAAHYHAPCPNHVHTRPPFSTAWHTDIAEWRPNRPHRLLVGAQNRSFAWQAPAFVLKPSAIGATAHHRVFDSISAFTAALEEVRR